MDLTNGAMVYASDTTAPYDFGTTATHSCNSGYSLVGVEVRTCGGDGSSVTGGWDSREPTCERTLAILTSSTPLLLYYNYSYNNILFYSYRVSRSRGSDEWCHGIRLGHDCSL